MREIKANYADRRRQAWSSGGGSPFTAYPKGALEVSAEERTRVYDEWWQRGGVLFSKAFPDQLSNPEANDTAGNTGRVGSAKSSRIRSWSTS